MTTESICSACSWSEERQDGCRYNSHVKLFYGVSDRGVWSLGSKFILKERSTKDPNFQSVNVEFLKANTTIPLPTIVENWTESDDRYFELARRVPGEPLSEAWPSLTADEKERIARQTAEFLGQLRHLQSSRIESLGGKPVYDCFLISGPFGQPHGPFKSDEELWAEMSKAVAHAPEQARQYLQERFPPSQPYTFSHTDLTDVNIMVENGNLSAIIDWESSGYYPVWWEYVNAGLGKSVEDAEWKKLLKKYMPQYEDAWDFYRDFLAVKRYPEMNVRGEELLKRLSG